MHELRIERSANTHRLLRGKCEFSLMRCNIRSANSTLRTARALSDPYGSNGWLSLLPPQTTRMSLMLCNIPSVNCTLRSVRTLNHPYGSNGSLSLLPPTLSSNSYVFSRLPNEMQSAIRELYSTERKGTLPSVRIERIVKPSAPTLS